MTKSLSPRIDECINANEGKFPNLKDRTCIARRHADAASMQVNARMGGGPVCLMNQLVWGVDLVEEQMLASAGIPSRPYIAARPDKFVAEYSVNAKHTGIIKNVDFVQVLSPASPC